MAVASLANRVQVNTNCANNDALYGPYNSIAEAIRSIPHALLNGEGARGRTIGVLEDGKVIEYWWQLVDGGYKFVNKGAVEIVVDSELNSTSTHPIQNQAVANALGEKADSSTVSGIDSRVSTLEGTITSKADNSTVEALQTAVGGKAESSEVSALSDRVDSVETELDGKVSSDTFNETIGSLNGDIAGKSDKIAKQEVEGDQTISPNTMYVWGEVTSLNITKGAAIDGIVNNYMVRFTAGAGCVVNFLEFALQWYGGDKPTWTAGNTYEISIVDNIALWAEIEPTQA